jgi:hypothetical protein
MSAKVISDYDLMRYVILRAVSGTPWGKQGYALYEHLLGLKKHEILNVDYVINYLEAGGCHVS